MPRFVKIQPKKIEHIPLFKIALKNRLFLAPSWWDAILTHPPLPRGPHRRTKPTPLVYPEEAFKKAYEQKYNQPFDAYEPDKVVSLDGFTRRLIPKDNRWVKNPSEIFALKQLDYVYKGYSTKESHDLVQKEFKQKRIELEMEKEMAARQMAAYGVARTSAADLLKEIEYRAGKTKFALARRVDLEAFMVRKKLDIKKGNIRKLTPSDMSPEDSEFYLNIHPEDRQYFDIDAYIKFQASGSLTEVEEEAIDDEEGEETQDQRASSRGGGEDYDDEPDEVPVRSSKEENQEQSLLDLFKGLQKSSYKPQRK